MRLIIIGRVDQLGQRPIERIRTAPSVRRKRWRRSSRLGVKPKTRRHRRAELGRLHVELLGEFGDVAQTSKPAPHVP